VTEAPRITVLKSICWTEGSKS